MHCLSQFAAATAAVCGCCCCHIRSMHIRWQIWCCNFFLYMIFIDAWFIDISIYGCTNVSTQNAGSDFLFVEFSSFSISFPLPILLQHFCCCIFHFSAAAKILKDCRGSKSKCKTENKTSSKNSSKEAQMFSGGRSRTQVKACSLQHRACSLLHQLRPLVLEQGKPAAAPRVVPHAAATRWVRHIKGNGAKIWHAVSSCLEYRSEHWPQMQLQLPSPSLFGIIAQPPLQQLFCALVSTFFFRLPAKILVRKVSGIARKLNASAVCVCVCFFSTSLAIVFAMLRLMRRIRDIWAVLFFFVARLLGYLPCAEVHVVSCGEYRSVSLLITSICSSVSCTASRCCASQGT